MEEWVKSEVTTGVGKDDSDEIEFVSALAPVFDRAVSSDAYAVYLAGMTSAESRRTMASSLELLAELLVNGEPSGRAERMERRKAGELLAASLPWHLVRYGHAVALRSWVGEHCEVATANKHLSALRGVVREAWRLQQISGEDMARVVDVVQIPGESLPAGRYVEDGEIRRLVKACLADERPIGRRDAAVLAILFVGGLRRAEASGLDIDNYVNGSIEVRKAKRNRQRKTALPGGGRRAVEAWIAIRGDTPGPLFCPLDKADRVTIRRLTPQTIYDIVGRRAANAGIPTFTPHDGRRTFASDLFDTGADIATVQKLMGHSSVNTTARYDRRPDRVRRAAVEKLHFPYPTEERDSSES